MLIQISPPVPFHATLRLSGCQTCCHTLENPEESRTMMANIPDVAGIAALTICESLLLALNDRDILPEREIVGILQDAAATHENAPHGDGADPMHLAVTKLITAIIDGGNSVRRK